MSTTAPSITRAQFAASATPVTVTVGTRALDALPREFSTGSLGYQANGKAILVIDGVPTLCQVGVTVTVIGSKTLPRAG
jgi:hypothetical protein